MESGDSELHKSDEESSMTIHVEEYENENWDEWERQRRDAVVQVVTYTSYLTYLMLIQRFSLLR